MEWKGCAIGLGYIIVLSAYIWLGRVLARDSSRDVRVVTYFFSLAVTVTAVIVGFAVHAGAVSDAGEFVGEAGEWFRTLLKVMLDLPTDIAIFFAAAVTVLLPQFLSYLLSLPVRSARAPLLVGFTLKIFLWLVVKSFTTFAGVMVAISIAGSFLHWPTVTIQKALSVCLVGISFVVLALGILVIYRDASQTVEALKRTKSGA
jgi:hypothetical protein